MIAQQAWSWGSLGHKTSANIAWNYLDADTKAKVTTLLNGQSLAEAAVWADAARANKEWKFTIWFHFEKAPDNFSYLDNLKRQSPDTRKLGGLVEALYIAEDTIKDPNASAVDKENALKFAVHFVGDIHQPLHTGRVEDNSGNKIPVKWLGIDTNLHSIWDSQMIYLGHKDVLADPSAAGDQALAYANYLMTKYKDFTPSPEMFQRYDDWMHESMVPRKDAYDFKDLTEQQYTNKFLETVDSRVYMAGLRIAWTVKRLVSTEAPTDPLILLRKAIVEIVGDFSEFVSLKPKYLATVK